MKRISLRALWLIVPLFLLALVTGSAYSATLLKGDVNGDGVVNVFDALLTLQYSVGLIEHTDANNSVYLSVADVAPLEYYIPKGDSLVNVFDALAILRHSVGLDTWKAPVVALVTSMGTITITLAPDKAPVTVQNFLAYVQDGFYNGLIFHRVIKDFMIQGGGFDVSLTQKATKPPIINEANNGLSNKRGTVAMARTSVVDSATSQFFINTVDNTFLDYTAPTTSGYGYAVFGEVTGGMEVVDAIRAVATTTYNGLANLPVVPVIIQSAHSIP